MAPHNLLTGHLLVLSSVMPLFPKDVIKTYIFEIIVRRFGKNGAVYLDLWPFSEPFLILTSPHLANQANSPPVALEKPNALRVWTWSLSGGTNLFDAPPEEWKPLRALFSRGFSANHLMNLVPSIVEETQVYCTILRKHAKLDDLFFLDTTNVKFMLDVIGRTAL
jgi:cytochrome P450